MWRRLRVLVSLLCLVAYLFSNTHLNQALALFATRNGPDATATKETDAPSPRKCKHCAKRATSTCATPVTAGKDHHPNDDAACPHDLSCPCCPEKGHQCPVPGGCSLCSIAKAPWLTPLPPDADLLSMVCFLVPEYRIAYISPSCDGLIRPPKA